MMCEFLNIVIEEEFVGYQIDMCYCESCGTWFGYEDVDMFIHGIRDYVARLYDPKNAPWGPNMPVPTAEEIDVYEGRVCSEDCFNEAVR